MRRIQLTLSLLGCVFALTGALLLLAASFPLWTRLQFPETLPVRAVYVGTDACFTCHADQQDQWVNPLNPRAIDASVVNPHTFSSNLSADAALPIGSNLDTLAIHVFDGRFGTMFPNTYHFAGQYLPSLVLSDEGEEQLQ